MSSLLKVEVNKQSVNLFVAMNLHQELIPAETFILLLENGGRFNPCLAQQVKEAAGYGNFINPDAEQLRFPADCIIPMPEQKRFQFPGTAAGQLFFLPGQFMLYLLG